MGRTAGSCDQEAIADQAQPRTRTIVVTARRRAESLQDVPIAVTAYSGEALERQGAIDITDISDTTPNVTLETSRGTNTTLTAFIRGVGPAGSRRRLRAGVGLYLDDVFLEPPQAAFWTSTMSSGSRCCAGRRARSTAQHDRRRDQICHAAADDEPTRCCMRRQLRHLRPGATLHFYKRALAYPMRSASALQAARLSRGGLRRQLNCAESRNYTRHLCGARHGRARAEPERLHPHFRRLYQGQFRPEQRPPPHPGLVSGAPVLDDVYDTRAGLNSPEQEIEAYGGAFARS
jgi:iron complex outermembrane receptor protein